MACVPGPVLLIIVHCILGGSDGQDHHGLRRPWVAQCSCSAFSWRLWEAPEAELVMGLQVCEHLQRVAKPLGVWVAPIVGGISPAKQTRLLGRQPQVPSLPAP